MLRENYCGKLTDTQRALCWQKGTNLAPRPWLLEIQSNQITTKWAVKDSTYPGFITFHTSEVQFHLFPLFIFSISSMSVVSVIWISPTRGQFIISKQYGAPSHHSTAFFAAATAPLAATYLCLHVNISSVSLPFDIIHMLFHWAH